MARTALASNAYNEVGQSGFDPLSATFATLATGSGNGVTVNYNSGRYIALYSNGLAGVATFTIITKQPANLTTLSLTVPDKTYAVPDETLWLIPFNAVFRQGDDMVYIDCDVAGKLAVLV